MPLILIEAAVGPSACLAIMQLHGNGMAGTRRELKQMLRDSRANRKEMRN